MEIFSKHNTTVMGQKVPPPTPLNDILATPRSKATTPALLHSAYTRVGRAVLCMCLAALPLFFGSCEKEASVQEDIIHTGMSAFYVESKGLMETSADSVCNYYKKLAGFHNTYPECESDELYPPTVKNLGDAFNKYGIVQIGSIIVQTEWEGEIVINF